MTLCANCDADLPSTVKRCTATAKVPYSPLSVGDVLLKKGLIVTRHTRICKPCLYEFSKPYMKEEMLASTNDHPNQAKRKSSNPDDYDDKWYSTKYLRIEEDETASTNSKNKRVRKKSAKLIEMEEYEVIEKKILKPTSKTASVSKTSPQLNKADGLSTCNLDSLASVATAELNLKSHITEPQITEAPLPVAEPPATEPAVTESLVTALPVMEEELLNEPCPDAVEIKSEPASPQKHPKVQPLKLKHLSTGAPSISIKTAESPTPNLTKPKTVKLKSPKPKPSFEDQLVGPDNVAVQVTPKKKKPKKVKPLKEKPPEELESPGLPSPPANVKLNIKPDDSGLKMKLSWEEEKTDQFDSGIKSDEDQPAIWPSQIRDEKVGRVLVKLKKRKKMKRKKLDGDHNPGKNETIVGSVGTSVGSVGTTVGSVGTTVGSVSTTVGSVDGAKGHAPKLDSLGVAEQTSTRVDTVSEHLDMAPTSEGQLHIDLDRKKEGKSVKRKKLKKAKKQLAMESEQLVVEPDIEEKIKKEENPEELDDSGVHLVNMYSNTEVMAMKLKTSREKKASSGTTKQKEKRFRRRGPTAYTMFSNNYRTKVLTENPGIDFAQISKRLGEIWQCLPAKEKMMWKRKAKQRVNKIRKLNNERLPESLNNMVFTSKVPSMFRKRGTSLPNRTTGKKNLVKTNIDRIPITLKLPHSKASAIDETASSTLLGQLLTSHIPEPSSSQPENVLLQKADDTVSCKPLDVAAHLKLLGDSLQTIGFRLQDHRGPIAVQGSLSVLLDSAICAMGSLMCLTNQLHQLPNSINKTHSKNLDNIAYIMPGIG